MIFQVMLVMLRDGEMANMGFLASDAVYVFFKTIQLVYWNL